MHQNLTDRESTLLDVPKKREGPDSAMGLNAKDEGFMFPKKVSLLLSGNSVITVELLLLPFETN